MSTNAPKSRTRADDAVERGARLERLEHFALGVGRLLLDHGPPGEHEPPRRRHDLGDEALERLAHHLLEVFDPPGAHEARRHEAAEPGDLALEAALVGGRDAGLDDHARLELRPVFDGDGPVGRGHVVEAVVFVAGADRELEHVADDLRHVVERPTSFSAPCRRPPRSTNAVSGPTLTDRAHHPGARIERGLGLGRHAARERSSTATPSRAACEVGLEIFVERGPQVRHGHPLGGRQHVGERRLRGRSSPPALAPAASAVAAAAARRLAPGVAVGGARSSGRLGAAARLASVRGAGTAAASTAGGGAGVTYSYLGASDGGLHTGPLRADRNPPRRPVGRSAVGELPHVVSGRRIRSRAHGTFRSNDSRHVHAVAGGRGR